ncbi:DUF4148 domain-containing protein [Paraburkholderia ginsengiterrae]|nr:DUF4148 domain-containing protein [Paraburkholderia ginsengiterrae]
MMKAVWVPLCAGVLAALTVMSAQAAELTRAQVRAEFNDYKAVGYDFSEDGYPQSAVDAGQKVAALRAQRAADAAKVATQPVAGQASQ